MSSDWKKVVLEDALDELIDYRGKTPKKSDSGIPLITAKIVKNGRIETPAEFISEDIYDDWMQRGFPEKGDIVMTTEAPLGEIAQLYSANVALAQRIVTLRGKKGLLNNDYLLYLMQSDFIQHQLEARASGSTVRGIKQSELRKIDLLIPSLEEQEDIANQLKTIDKKIYLNRQTNETLEAMAQAIFKSWFVDFDPVHAKIEARSAGRDLNRAAMAVITGISLDQGWDEVESALDQKLSNMTEEQRQQLTRTAELFPDELVESDIGKVPKGWEVVNYGKLIEYMIGGDWGKEEPTKKHTERVRIFRGTDLPDVFHGNDESVPVRFVQSKKLKTRKLKHGDIVFEVSGGSKNQSTGRNLLISEKLIKRFGSDLEPASFCKLMRPASIELSYYLGVYLRKAYDDDLMWQFQVQSTGISNFQTSTFMDQHCLVVPKEEILKQFQGFVEPIFDKIYNNENSELKKLRDTLLPRLISGEIQI